MARKKNVRRRNPKDSAGLGTLALVAGGAVAVYLVVRAVGRGLGQSIGEGVRGRVDAPAGS